MLKLYNISYTEIIRMSNNGNISPDGKWKIIIEDNQVKWVELTEPKYQYTIEEIVQATKDIKPNIW
jgi:hypothetical protein